MVAAVHRLPKLGAAELRRLLRDWGMRVDWRTTRIVVWVGARSTEPWAVLRSLSPLAQVVCYDKGATYDRPAEGAVVVGTETELVATVSQSYHSRDRIEIAGEPALREQQARVRGLVDAAVEYAVAMEATIRAHSQEWVDLGLRLIPLMAGRPAVQSLPRAWEGRPAIIVGAGPSLDDDLETLAGLGDRALILAASTAAGPLDRAGVQPHVWACAEQRDAASEDLAALGSSVGTWLVPGVHCHERFWNLESLGTIPLVATGIGVGTLLGQAFGLPSLATGGSVTTYCYALARILGASPIVLVGQDCAIPRKGSTHAAGRSGDRDVSRDLQVTQWREAGLLREEPAWGGLGHVTTTPAGRIFRGWFEQQAVVAPIINTSRRGARIAGTVETRLEDVRFEPQALLPADALAGAVAEAPRMERGPILAALRQQREIAEGHIVAATAAAASARRCVEDVTEMHRAGQHGALSAMYATPSLKEVAIVQPRHGVEALASIAQRVVDRGPVLVERIDEAIAALGGDDA